jgi:xanthine dehydrogenase accessory factor
MNRLPAELETLAAWLADGRKAALATVVATWGSSPRPAGSLLAVRDDGLFQGSVSGGCVESTVIAAALESLADGQPRDLSFGVADQQAWDVGLACGGRIRIVVESWSGREVELADIKRRLRNGESVSRDIQLGQDGIFRHVIAPPPRLIAIGAVHIAQCLAPMAALAGYDVTIVDPRTAFASAARFENVAMQTDWPDAAVRDLAPDSQTAIVTLTHDPKLDDPALVAALASPAGYIAALGSRKTHVARLERLAAAGCTGLDRVHAPAGLALGALTPGEIAVSVLAEMIQTRRQAAP